MIKQARPLKLSRGKELKFPDAVEPAFSLFDTPKQSRARLQSYRKKYADLLKPGASFAATGIAYMLRIAAQEEGSHSLRILLELADSATRELFNLAQLKNIDAVLGLLKLLPRDMDLIRDLLLRFERDDDSVPAGHTQEEVAYHVKQMKLAGLIDAHIVERPSPGKRKPVEFIVHDIMPAGHDFIAKIRSDTLWSKIKSEAAKRGVPLTIDLLAHVATHVAKATLGL